MFPIVFLAPHYAWERWQTLNIPKGQSQAFDVGKDGAAYGLGSGERRG